MEESERARKEEKIRRPKYEWQRQSISQSEALNNSSGALHPALSNVCFLFSACFLISIYITYFLSMHVWHRCGGNNHLRTRCFILFPSFLVYFSVQRREGICCEARHGMAWHGTVRLRNEVVHILNYIGDIHVFQRERRERSFLACYIKKIAGPG
jgi:hypothetical protein